MEHNSSVDIHLAGLVRYALAAANHGTYPTTQDEWHEVARRLGVTVKRLPQLSLGACLLDSLLLHAEGTPEQLAKWFAHELAEERLRSECEPPFILPHPACQGAFHRVAAIVECLSESS